MAYEMDGEAFLTRLKQVGAEVEAMLERLLVPGNSPAEELKIV